MQSFSAWSLHQFTRANQGLILRRKLFYLWTNENAHRTSDTSTETATLSRPYRNDGSRHLEVPVPAVSAKRISWGAISAGVVMALVTQLAFSLLGLGLGASAFNPYDNHSAGNWGIGTAVYTLLSVLISLYVGGHVCGDSGFCSI
jgi:hypothetical protein